MTTKLNFRCFYCDRFNFNPFNMRVLHWLYTDHVDINFAHKDCALAYAEEVNEYEEAHHV